MGSEIHRVLSERDFDIVQIEYTQMAQYVPNTRRSCTLLTDHEVAFAAHLRAFKRLPLSWSKFKSFMGWIAMLDFELRACKEFDRVVTVTDVDRQELLAYEPELDVVTIPTGVDSTYFSLQQIPEEPNTLIFVGYFKHFPNIHGILTFCREVLPLIREEIPGVKLYVVGASPPEKVLRLAEDEQVVVTGWVEDLRPYIARSTVFVAPLWLGVGIRGKIFEAWGMEKPVVTTSVGSQGIACTAGEDILIGDGPQEFAAHTVRLLRDEKLRKKLGRNGRRLVEAKYDWEIIIGKVEEMYDDLLTKKFGRCS
jgi:glycosyltransferase involved in cell wall biosynthesis